MDVRGTTYLLAKNNDTKDPKIYRSITCLSTTNKLLTSVLTAGTYLHLQQNPPEKKRCRLGLYGCKDQLMINNMILENCKKRKQILSCGWLGYKKVFESVPHEWILRSLELFKVTPRVIGFLKRKMKGTSGRHY